jgi:hypothetical protein
LVVKKGAGAAASRHSYDDERHRNLPRASRL